MALIQFSTLILCFVTHIFYLLVLGLRWGFLSVGSVLFFHVSMHASIHFITMKETGYMLIIVNFSVWNSSCF